MVHTLFREYQNCFSDTVCQQGLFYRFQSWPSHDCQGLQNNKAHLPQDSGSTLQCRKKLAVIIFEEASW